ncbi:MAG: cryptochrome/photolyase family protein [Planctomycetes bacterium]|nr:cryptochrome/photolyase family protein [Planctomycetota bacterium]
MKSAPQPLAPGSTLAFVLGDQLSERLEGVASLRPGVDAVLMAEVKGESRHPPSHRQRTVMFLSAMRHFAARLRGGGHCVRYVALDDPANTHALGSELARAITDLRPSRVVFTRPGDHRVEAELTGVARSAGVTVQVFEDTHFLTTTAQFSAWAQGRKALTMEYFYRDQRKRLGVLVDDDGQPEGGAWNFDADNRERFKSDPLVPEPRRTPPDDITREVIALVARELPELPGSTASFGWAVTPSDALDQFKHFVRSRLAMFGPYEDAMWTGQAWLYHAQASPAMNLKILDPREMLMLVLDAHRAGKAPLQSVEGFVRQIIGWREFIRGVYFHEGPSYQDRNTLGHTGQLPEFYWTGRTDMRCMRECVGQVLEHGYGHHIQRLMITGNFALIAGVEPKAVSDWYLGMYVDGVDWVTLPNTLGMSQHADGGVVGTKPYAASANYIGKMSNYCKGCRYDPGERTGERACPFNTLYWDFMIRHHDRFKRNQRMSMMGKNTERLSKVEVIEITREGRRLKQAFGVEP